VTSLEVLQELHELHLVISSSKFFHNEDN